MTGREIIKKKFYVKDVGGEKKNGNCGEMKRGNEKKSGRLG